MPVGVGRAGETLRKARVATAAFGVHADKASLRSRQPCNTPWRWGRVVRLRRTAVARWRKALVFTTAAQYGMERSRRIHQLLSAELHFTESGVMIFHIERY